MDGTFYKIIKRENDKIDAQCEECGEIKRGNIQSTGNFKSHYKKHGTRKKELDEYLKQQNMVQAENHIEGKSSRQPSIRETLPPVSEDKVNNPINNSLLLIFELEILTQPINYYVYIVDYIQNG